VQIGIDGNDQNKAVNLKGVPTGTIASVRDEVRGYAVPSGCMNF
jgi:hypothetical protein